ncbi:MAG: hypothetical protein QXX99_00395 [Candidatus Bathyarchaeia archaeon]
MLGADMRMLHVVLGLPQMFISIKSWLAHNGIEIKRKIKGGPRHTVTP